LICPVMRDDRVHAPRRSQCVLEVADTIANTLSNVR
jgi:hypothetical protein